MRIGEWWCSRSRSLATGMLVGLMPALHASAIDPNRDLTDGGRTVVDGACAKPIARVGRAGGRAIGGVAHWRQLLVRSFRRAESGRSRSERLSLVNLGA
jgi:hypothetical protein